MRAFHLLTVRIDGHTLHADVPYSQLIGQECINNLIDDFEQLCEFGASVVRLDLRSVQFIDARFVGTLITLAVSLKKVRARLIVQASRDLAEVLRITKLDQLFELIDRDGEASATDSA